MSNSIDSNAAARKAICAELDSLTAIARGTLTEEFREKEAPDGSGTVRLGPYYKHQFWADGRNHSARVPAPCVPLLREQLRNGESFEQLTSQLAAMAIKEGAAQREAVASKSHKPVEPDAALSKKNSKKSASTNATKKRRATSARSSPSSRRKA